MFRRKSCKGFYLGQVKHWQEFTNGHSSHYQIKCGQLILNYTFLCVVEQRYCSVLKATITWQSLGQMVR